MEKEHLNGALAMLFHRIKTPLNAISGFTSLLVSDDCSVGDRPVYARMINQASEQLLKTVNEVIDYCSYGYQSKMEKHFFDINKTIDRLFSIYSPLAGAKDIKFTCEKGSDQPDSFIWTDDNKLEQLLETLLDNALKYTESGEIRLGYKTLDNSQILVYVRDTGVGVKEEEKEKIFDLFYRSPEMQVKGIEGTGIGLGVAALLAEALGTEVKLETEYCRGSNFWFVLERDSNGHQKSERNE